MARVDVAYGDELSNRHRHAVVGQAACGGQRTDSNRLQIVRRSVMKINEAEVHRGKDVGAIFGDGHSLVGTRRGIVYRTDVDVDDVGVSGTPVVGENLNRRRATVIGIAQEGQSVERSVDGSIRAAKGKDTVRCAVAVRKAKAGRTVQRDRSMRRGQRNAVARVIRVGDAQLIAIPCIEEQGGILIAGLRSRHRIRRRVIGAGDGDGERGARGRAVGILDGIGEHILCRRALRQRIGVGIGVVEGVAVAAVAVERERAIGAGDGRADIAGGAIHSTHRTGVAGIHIGVVAEHVAAGARVSGECCVARIDTGLAHRIAGIGVGHCDRAVIGAGDGDGERSARGGAVGIAHRVIEHLGGARPCASALVSASALSRV